VSIMQITDGTSNTAMVGEVTALPAGTSGSNYTVSNIANIPIWAGGNPNFAGCDGTHWSNYFRYMDVNYPVGLNTGGNSDYCFNSQHTGGAQFVFADGSVHFLARGISANTYQALGTIATGDAVDGSQF